MMPLLVSMSASVAVAQEPDSTPPLLTPLPPLPVLIDGSKPATAIQPFVPFITRTAGVFVTSIVFQKMDLELRQLDSYKALAANADTTIALLRAENEAEWQRQRQLRDDYRKLAADAVKAATPHLIDQAFDTGSLLLAVLVLTAVELNR